MSKVAETRRADPSPKELEKLRGELWIILPFFAFTLFIFLGSFQYKFEAAIVPMFVGAGMLILAGSRLFHIIFPKSRIGEFKESGLAGEFDSIKDQIEEELQKRQEDKMVEQIRVEEPAKPITFREERKAFFSLLFCFGVVLLLGYLVGGFFVIVGTCYYYGFKKKKKILIALVSMYFIIYVCLYKLLGAPTDFGILLQPILESLNVL
ncbi:MAG: hypothetical protein ACE144_19540 [Thermodesulfobacteriota bacterium]